MMLKDSAPHGVTPFYGRRFPASFDQARPLSLAFSARRCDEVQRGPLGRSGPRQPGGGGPGGGLRGGGMGGNGVGSDSGGGSRGASFGGLGMRAIFCPFGLVHHKAKRWLRLVQFS
jgi:hypothetical protein